MANYFNHFPKTPYIVERNGDLNLVTNIMTRVKFLDDIKNNVSSYYLYNVKDGETPEILAFNFYGSMHRHWILLLMNDVIDAQFDWYKGYDTFNKYIDKKYSDLGGISYTQSNIKKYLIDETRTVNYPNQPLSITETRETDSFTWSSTAESSVNITLTNSYNYSMTKTIKKRTQSIYNYELELNESRKSIKVLKKEYVDRVEKEMKNIANVIPISAI